MSDDSFGAYVNPPAPQPAAEPAQDDLAEAGRRLDSALDRLEGLLQSRSEKLAELRRALQAADEENARLRDLVSQVADRLDGAVERLEGALED